jgi:hypothetical protein
MPVKYYFVMKLMLYIPPFAAKEGKKDEEQSIP